ncbi:MAG: hypothetical protein K0U98_00690 [Deltaproteobacteria bacterium]|nr:hypothetical protein [Deltaproteobacteria bacterium]
MFDRVFTRSFARFFGKALQGFTFFSIVFGVVLPSPLQAQSLEANHWHYGVFAAFDFSSGLPVASSDGCVSTSEGSAAVSDSCTGELLFSTDGMEVYDASCGLLAAGLEGNLSSTQNSLFLPHPGDADLFYLFTADSRDGNPLGEDGRGIHFYELSRSLGTVTTPLFNQLLVPAAEKLVGVRKPGGGYWALAHGWSFNVATGSNAFHAWEISSAGLNPTAIVSNVGSNHGEDPFDLPTWVGATAAGALKASPQGDRLATAVYDPGFVEVFDFDAATGVVSNPCAFSTGLTLPYGLSFSPDGQRLYVTDLGDLFQFDLSSGDCSTIGASGTLIYSFPTGNIRSLQIGADSKIYLHGDSVTVARIDNPNAVPALVTFDPTAVPLPTNGRKGFPNFIDSYILQPAPGSSVPPEIVPFAVPDADRVCVGDSIIFPGFFDALSYFESLTWSGGSPGTGWYTYPDVPGDYTLTGVRGCDSVTSNVITAVDCDCFLNAGDDRTLCAGSCTTLGGVPGGPEPLSTAPDGASVQWTPSGPFTDPTDPNPILCAPAGSAGLSRTFRVWTDFQGCYPDIPQFDEVTVTVVDC